MAPRRKPLYLELIPKKPPGTYYIRGTCEFTNERIKKSTGCVVDPRQGIDETSQANDVLADFVKQRRAAQRPTDKVKNANADEVIVADVISYYIDNRVFGKPTDRHPKPLSRPKETLARLEAILSFFGEMTMNELDPEVFNTFRDMHKEQASRRMLEDFRSAINMYVEDGKMRHAVNVPLPPKSSARDDWLTWQEVRHIIKVAWKKRGVYFDEQKHPTKGFIWRHLVPYILVGVLTGSRYNKIVRASFTRQPGRPWINLETGEYWRVAPGEIEYGNKLSPDIALPRLLIRILRRYREHGAEYVVEWKGQNATNIGKAMRKLLDEAVPKRHIVAHTFRHTAATWLVSDPTVPLIDISNYLGMSFETIHRRYAKVRDRKGNRVAAAIDRLRKEEFMPISTKSTWRDPSNRKKKPGIDPTTFDNINGNDEKPNGTKSSEKPTKSRKAA